MGIAAIVVGVLGFLLVSSALGHLSKPLKQIIDHSADDSFAGHQAFPAQVHFPFRSKCMFRDLVYDFTCPQCGQPNDGSQIVAGLSREEAQTNILTRLGLVCSHCGEALLADAEIHFSRNNVSHVWNR
jgi:hypothetical protein